MKHHLVIPAAGRGQRFGGPVTKQYADLCGAPVIERTLESLLALQEFDSVSVGLAADSEGWKSSYQWRRVDGGSSRAETVFNILESLDGIAREDDWVWVHDAVRPFLSQEVVARLLRAVGESGECFVLGLPATDTLKRINTEDVVEETLDRSRIWYAQTPQVCQFSVLREALGYCLKQGLAVTDEAAAMEYASVSVKMVLGSEDNIKITRPGDMKLAELIYTGRVGA